MRANQLEGVPDSSLRNRLRSALQVLVRKSFGRHPDSFASLFPTPIFPSPVFALADPAKLEGLIHAGPESLAGSSCTSADEAAMRDSIYADLADLRARRQLLSATLQENLTAATPDSTMEDRARLAAIEHLDAFEFPHRVRDTHRSIFLAATASQSLTWPDALPLFFTYAITPSRPCSGHRRYLVAQLISMERERLQSGKKRVTRSAALLANPSTLPGAEPRVEDAFVRWIDTLDQSLVEKHDVRLLTEELFRAGVMNYGAYLQRMIARGETERELDGDGDGESIHLWILRTVPLDPSLAGVKRRVAFDEAPAKPTREVEPKLAKARHDVEQLFGAAARGAQTSVPALLESVRQLVEDGSQWAVTRDILPTAVSGRIDRATGRLNISRDVLAVTCQIYQSVKDWAGLLQVSEHAPSLSFLGPH